MRCTIAAHGTGREQNKNRTSGGLGKCVDRCWFSSGLIII